MNTKPFRFTFRKEERLCSQKLIRQLYGGKEVKSYFQYPLRASWLFINSDSTYPVQVVFPVSRKLFKKAHDRNAIRRLVRESYRLQKQSLYDSLTSRNCSCILAVSFIAKEKLPYQDIFNATTAILYKIAESAQQTDDFAAPATSVLL